VHRLPSRDVCHRHARTDERVGGRTRVGLSQPEKGQDSSDDDHQSDEVDDTVHERLLSMPAADNHEGTPWFRRIREQRQTGFDRMPTQADVAFGTFSDVARYPTKSVERHRSS